MPTKFNKRSEIILPKSNEYLVAATSYSHPIVLEKSQELKLPKKLSKIHSNAIAKSKLYAPSLGVAEISGMTGYVFFFYLKFLSNTIYTVHNV